MQQTFDNYSPRKSTFDLRDHIDKLVLDGGSQSRVEGSYLCPLCAAKNFKVDLRSGKYSTFSCNCASTPEGKKAIRDAVAPVQKWVKQPRPKQRREWVYRDANGAALIKVVRIDDGSGKKRITQESLISGQTPKDLQGQVRPYRYLDCLDAIAAGQKVFWVEGEASADALWLLGFAATTTIRGSGGYSSEQYAGLFPGASVVVCPDRDLPGIKYSEAIAADYGGAGWLYAYPDSYLWGRLTDYADGADIGDWVADGATAADILAAIGLKRDLSPARSKPSKVTPIQEDAPTMPLDQAVREVLLNGGSEAQQTIQLDRLKQAYNYTGQIRDLVTAVATEIEREESAGDSTAYLEELEKVREVTLDVAKMLPGCPELTQAISCWSALSGVQGSVYLTTLFSVIASVVPIGTKLRLNGSWCAKPIFWSGIVGNSGDGKTPAQSKILSPLETLNSMSRESEAEAFKDYQKELRSAPRDDQPDPPAPERHWVIGNCTMEALAAHQAQQLGKRAGLLIRRDELKGLFGDQNAYRAGGKGSDQETLLELKGGGPLSAVRKGVGASVYCPESSISITGTIQPWVLNALMGNMDDGSGIWPRFCWDLVCRRTPAKPSRLSRDPDLSGQLMTAYDRISRLVPLAYELDSAAFEEWADFVETMEARWSATPLDAFKSCYAKAKQDVGTIALLLHLFEHIWQGQNPPALISKEAMQRAITVALYYLGQVALIHQLSEEAEGQIKAQMDTVLAYLRKRPKRSATVHDLKRGIRSLKANAKIRTPQIVEICQHLAATGVATYDPVGKTIAANGSSILPPLPEGHVDDDD